MITESPNKLYKVTMAGSSPSVQHIIDLRSAASGIVYNDNTDEIVWGEGSHIKKMSANGSLYSINSGIRGKHTENTSDLHTVSDIFNTCETIAF